MDAVKFKTYFKARYQKRRWHNFVYEKYCQKLRQQKKKLQIYFIQVIQVIFSGKVNSWNFREINFQKYPKKGWNCRLISRKNKKFTRICTDIMFRESNYLLHILSLSLSFFFFQYNVVFTNFCHKMHSCTSFIKK